MAYIVMAYIVMAYIVTACIVTAYIVTAYIVTAYIVMAYIVMAYIAAHIVDPRPGILQVKEQGREHGARVGGHRQGPPLKKKSRVLYMHVRGRDAWEPGILRHESYSSTRPPHGTHAVHLSMYLFAHMYMRSTSVLWVDLTTALELLCNRIACTCAAH